MYNGGEVISKSRIFSSMDNSTKCIWVKYQAKMYMYLLIFIGYYEAGEMFSSISSMSSSMTTSLQLAKDCLESERGDTSKTEQIEGVQKFANMIDSG